MVLGECLHLANSFVCTQGKYQNYPCPYRNDISKCGCSIKVTEKMIEQWNKYGYITLPVKEI